LNIQKETVTMAYEPRGDHGGGGGGGQGQDGAFVKVRGRRKYIHISHLFLGLFYHVIFIQLLSGSQ
jgi:hypothetical protein